MSTVHTTLQMFVARLRNVRTERVRRYPAVQEPVADVQQLANEVRTLKEIVEILVRERGEIEDSALVVRDLPFIIAAVRESMNNQP